MISVILKTRNGATTIGQTLQSLAHNAPPSRGWELVVVDNGSTDNSVEIVRSWQDRLPIKLVTEPREGRAHAMNAGIAAASGDLIVFTDDDVAFVLSWLASWESTTDRYPDLALFGGAIEPRFKSAPPTWMQGDVVAMAICFGATCPGRPEGPIIGHIWSDVFGGNIAIRRSVVDAGLMLDPIKIPAHLPAEETDLIYRAAKAGFCSGFVPQARVFHLVPPAHVRLIYIVRRYFRFGRAEARSFGEMEAPTRCTRVFGMRRYAIREIIVGMAALAWHWRPMSETARFAQLRHLLMLAGRTREEFALRAYIRVSTK